MNHFNRLSRAWYYFYKAIWSVCVNVQHTRPVQHHHGSECTKHDRYSTVVVVNVQHTRPLQHHRGSEHAKHTTGTAPSRVWMYNTRPVQHHRGSEHAKHTTGTAPSRVWMYNTHDRYSTITGLNVQHTRPVQHHRESKGTAQTNWMVQRLDGTAARIWTVMVQHIWVTPHCSSPDGEHFTGTTPQPVDQCFWCLPGLISGPSERKQPIRPFCAPSPRPVGIPHTWGFFLTIPINNCDDFYHGFEFFLWQVKHRVTAPSTNRTLTRSMPFPPRSPFGVRHGSAPTQLEFLRYPERRRCVSRSAVPWRHPRSVTPHECAANQECQLTLVASLP